MILILSLVLLALTANCAEHQAYHYKNGHLALNREKAVRIDGPIIVALTKKMNLTVIAGLHVKGEEKTAFEFVGLITNFTRMPNGTFRLKAKCKVASWGMKKVGGLEGVIKAKGVWGKHVHMHGSCIHKASSRNFTFGAAGNYSETGHYVPGEAAARAQQLVGQKDRDYKPVHVVNYAIFGFPYFGNQNCSLYLSKYFKTETNAKPGYVIVGKDAGHCGIVDIRGVNFIHSDDSKHVVVVAPLSAAKDYFKKGFFYKRY